MPAHASVCPRGKAKLPIEKSPWNFIIAICNENFQHNLTLANVTKNNILREYLRIFTWLLFTTEKARFFCEVRPHEISKPKANEIGHILRRNCLLRQVAEGKIKGVIEVTGKGGRRCRKLMDDLKERRGYSHMKEEALDCTMWRACFGRGFWPVVKQTTKWMNDLRSKECLMI